MNKLFMISVIVAYSSIINAVSLGEEFDNKAAITSNTTTSYIKLIDKNRQISTYQEISDHSVIEILVNNSNQKIYSLSWTDSRGVNLSQLLGTYYQEFLNAAKKPIMRIPRRAIVIDDGNLSFTQYGAMAAGTYGKATLKNLVPKE